MTSYEIFGVTLKASLLKFSLKFSFEKCIFNNCLFFLTTFLLSLTACDYFILNIQINNTVIHIVKKLLKNNFGPYLI